MRSVAILGAGAIGAAAARALAEREAVQRIVLVDAASAVAAGKALDIAQSGPIDGWDTRLAGAAALDAALHPSLVIVADRHGADGEWQGEAALDLLRRTLAVVSCPIVFAGTGQHGIMAGAARELGAVRARLVGSAPEALASAARALAALAARTSPADVSVSVVGVPGRFVCAWNESRVGGAAATTVLTPPELAKLDAQIRASWPPGPYGLGSAAAVVSCALLGGSPRRHTVFAVMTGSEGRRPVVTGVPATLGPGGIAAVHVPELSPRERLVFEGTLTLEVGD
jgi:malate dehydrogenase